MEEREPLKQDFDTGALLQEHHKGISSLEDKVSALEKKLSDPDLLAKMLGDAAEVSKRMDQVFSKLFCDMMKKDDAVKAAIKEKMDTADRDAVNSLLKKLGGKVALAVWTGVTLIFGAWAEHHFGK